MPKVAAGIVAIRTEHWGQSCVSLPLKDFAMTVVKPSSGVLVENDVGRITTCDNVGREQFRILLARDNASLRHPYLGRIDIGHARSDHRNFRGVQLGQGSLPQWSWQAQNEHAVKVTREHGVEAIRDFIRAKASLDANDLDACYRSRRRHQLKSTVRRWVFRSP